MSQPPSRSRTELCPTCLTFDTSDYQVITLDADMTVVTTYHLPDCAALNELSERMREGAAQTKAEEDKARAAFPGAYERLSRELGARDPDDPIVATLFELARRQFELFSSSGGFLIIPDWVEILDRHFPPPASANGNT